MPSLRISLCLLTLIPTLASARTWNVFADGTGDAPTIQAAADSSSPGDSIMVGAGTYLETLTLPNPVTLTTTAGPDATTLDAGGATFCLASHAAGDVLIEGLTLTGTTHSYGFDCYAAAVRVSGNAEIRDCHIRDNVSYDPYGGTSAAVVASGDVRIVDTQFRGNQGGSGGPACSPFPDGGCGVACLLLKGGTLAVAGCTFEDNAGSCSNILSGHGGEVLFRENVFRANPGWDRTGLFLLEGGPIRLEENLFLDNEGALISDKSSAQVELVGNTFAHNAGLASLLRAPPGSIVRGNVFTGGEVGLHLPAGGGGIIVECNNSWGNAVNWGGLDLTGVAGNISEPPLYCNPQLDDFAVAQNSPLLPANNSCGFRIGAFGQGCGPVAIEEMTWGRIKSRYRGQ